MNGKFILLCGLLLAGASRSRAEDPPPPGPAPVQEASSQEVHDPSDLNSDGTVTNKEKRQKRRADRRARRGTSGGAGGAGGAGESDSDDAESDEAQDAAATSEGSSRGSSASASASKAAAAMKSSMTPASAGALGGAGGPGGGASGPGRSGIGGDLRGGASAGTGPAGSPSSGSSPAALPPGGGAGGGNPANPKTQADFALAASSPYAPAFAKSGLKLGADGKTVTRLDGSPATAEDYSRLQREISSMPEALSRRPDFFSAISPGHYADVKNGIKDGKHADTVYKDVGTTDGDRDLVHTASCDKLSGDCNKNVEKSSYKKGDFVAPEDLDSMWAALQKELDGSAAKEDESSGQGRPRLGAKRDNIAEIAALNSTFEITGENPSEKAALDSTNAVSTSVARTAPVAAMGVAVTSVKRLWSTVALGLPGKDGRAESDTGLILLIGGGVALLSLVGIVIARRNS